jgi:hypothetical protein
MNLQTIYSTLSAEEKIRLRDKICEKTHRDVQWFYRRINSNNWTQREKEDISDVLGLPMFQLFAEKTPIRSYPLNIFSAYLIHMLKHEFDRLTLYLECDIDQLNILLERPEKMTTKQVISLAKLIRKESKKLVTPFTLIEEFKTGINNISTEQADLFMQQHEAIINKQSL